MAALGWYRNFMCILIVLRRPSHSWPVLIAANRDEMQDRPWLAPARHWPDRPEVTAGMDKLAGGSWLGVNDHGVTAAILNRTDSLGPAPGKRSRGEIGLMSLSENYVNGFMCFNFWMKRAVVLLMIS